MDILNKDFNQANDYALAKCLNERVWKILWYVADLYPFYAKDLDKINRNYIFLVKELLDIYDRNQELQDIDPRPLWQKYKHVDGYEEEEEADRQAAEALVPSAGDTVVLCEKAFHQKYPYQGSDVHSIMGLITNSPYGADTRLFKATVTIQNAFGAKYDATLECVTKKTGDQISIGSFTVY